MALYRNQDAYDYKNVGLLVCIDGRLSWNVWGLGFLMRKRVLLVDDEQAFLDLGHSLLSHNDDFQIVGEATNGMQAVTVAQDLQPDVVIIDVQMPGLNGFETTRRLLEVSPGSKVVLVSAADDPQYESLARSAGALGFIEKNQLSPERILALL